MNTDHFLLKLGIKNFKSIDNDGIYFKIFKKVNLFIGKNNSGKSNVLKFLKLLSENAKDISMLPNKMENQYNRNGINSSLFFKYSHQELGIPQIIPIITNGHNMVKKQTSNYLNDPLLFEYNLKEDSIEIPDYIIQGSMWNNGQSLHEDSIVRPILQKLNINESRHSGWEAFRLHFHHKISREVDSIIKRIIYIPEFRIVKEGNNLENSNSLINGANIISEMHKMINPDIGEEENFEKFQKIEETVKEMLGVTDLKIVIPHSKDKMIVVIDGRRLPLENFGAGLNEIILLCSALIMHPGYIVCLEEPELHLHPELQRKFLKFLFTTSNQYFITTHSNIFLDNANNELSVYHFKNDGIKTSISLTQTNSHTKEIIEDLGYKHSDLLQSNGIIWVEGPSDRNYIRKWISLLQPDFKEGIHFTIMFYGGKLLSHLSCNFEFFNDEFIYLLKINKNAFVLMDKDGITNKINATKTRIGHEIGEKNYWVTYGREIENYLSQKTVSSWLCSRDMKSIGDEIEKNDKFEAIVKINNSNFDYAKNKSLFSKELIQYIEKSDLQKWDLRRKLDQIIECIDAWNK